MAAVILTRTQIATFAVVITVVTLTMMAVPSPYPKGVGVDRHTGLPVPGGIQRLHLACATGSVDGVLARLLEEGGAPPAEPLLRGIVERMRQELRPLQLAGAVAPHDDAATLASALRRAADDAGGGDSVERLFRDARAGAHGIDAIAAELARRLATDRPPGVAELLSLCAEYERRGRQRAHWRWLLRTFARHPDSTAVVDDLIRICVAHGRLPEALAVADACTADRTRDEQHQRQRTQLAAWLGRPEVEVEALEHLVALSDHAADRGRLIELYSDLGTPAKALPHAIAVADGAAEVAEAEAAARAALTAGFADEAFAMLSRAATRAVDPAPWLRRIADYALLDLRVERAVNELELVAAVHPDGDDRALESLYRRTDQPERLADVLQRRLAREPGNQALWNEVVALRYGLGQAVLARRLQAQRAAALADPEAFLQQLPAELRAQAASVRSQALSLAMAGEADGRILGDVLDRLRPFLQAPEFREAAELLLIRHKDDPAAKPMRIELIDFGRTPLEATRAAADLAQTYPDDPELVRLWVERAGWAGMTRAEIDARRRLLELAPTDRDNRHQLAELLAFSGDIEAALPLWSGLHAEEGIGSAAVPQLVDALFDLGREGEALDLLQRLATDPEATTGHRLRAADELFYRRSYDRAKVLYATVLATEPRHAHALLRLGQIYAWTNDAETARGFFERRLATSQDDAALVRFYLGEALWATDEPARARELQAQAFAELSLIAEPDFTTRSLLATMLARLDRRPEAARAYRELVASSPRDLDLVLDYVDVLVDEGDFATADGLLRHGAVLKPDDQRLLRLRGKLALRRGDLLAADEALSRSIELHGADAGTCAELGQLRQHRGDWQGALASYERWLQLQADSAAARRLVGELRDKTAATGVASVRALRLGGDRAYESTLGAALPVGDGASFNLRAGHGRYRGAASALAAAASATTDVGLLDLALEMRADESFRWGLGVSAAPGAPGDTAVGAFASAYLASSEPFMSLEVRAFGHQLWSEPAAAPALGGRQSGVQGQFYSELPAGWWVGAAGAVERLTIEPMLTGSTVGDTRLRGEFTFGRRLFEGDLAVASRFLPRRVPAGPSSPFLLGDPEPDRAWLANAWLSVQSASLLGDAELPALLPIADDDAQAFVAARVDRHLAHGFGGSLAGNVGVDLNSGDEVWGVSAALTWRPSHGFEVSVAGSHAAALGRAGGGDIDELRLEGVLRW